MNDGNLYVHYNNQWVSAVSIAVPEVNTGNIEFRNDSMNDVNGILITNASQTIQPTASVSIPANDSGAPLLINNDDKTWTFGAEGKLTLPAGTTYEYFDTPLTGHGDGLARLDFTLATDGVSANWLAALPSPAGSGYSVGNTFTFNAAFLGIPGASVTIEVLSIGPGGSIDELAFSMPPLYPADIYRDSPINLQVGAESNRWTFGADSTLTLPGDLNVGNNSIREDGLFSQQFSIAAGAGKHVEISSNDGEQVWSFDTTGITLPLGGTLGETPAAITVAIYGAAPTALNQTYTIDPTNPDQYLGSNNCFIFRDIGTENKWRLREVSTDYYESDDLRSWTNLISGVVLAGGFPNPKTTDITVGDSTWTFGDNGNLKLPQYNQIASVGSNATITLNGVASNESILELATNVTGEQIASNFYMAPGGFGFNSVRNIDIHAGYDETTAKWSLWQAAEALWVTARNEDALEVAPDIRPWAGMASYLAYPVMLTWIGEGNGSPLILPLALDAKTAYDTWRAEQDSINVTVTARDKMWTFGNNGTLTVPGAIFGSGSLYLNSEGETNAVYIHVDGQNGRIILRTSDGTSFKGWFLDVNGETTLPGRLNFSDGSTYDNSRLTGAVDSDLEFEVKHTISISHQCYIGTVGEFVADVEFNDDITVANVGWTVVIGDTTYTVESVVEGAPANQFRLVVPGATFVTNETYTFTNPTPTSKVWTINSQNGTLIAPGNAILSSETTPLGGGDTYRDFSIELPTPDESNETRWTFSNEGILTFPDATTLTGKDITIPVDQSLTVNLSYILPDIGVNTFKINPESIKLPTGNGIIFSGDETAANRWNLDTTNKALSFPDAGDGVSPKINYSKDDNVTGMELITYAKSIKITAAQTSTWTFDNGGKLTLPADSSILTNETALNIATSPTATYTFDQAYWEALNANVTRMFTPSSNAQYFACTVTANQNGAYTVNVTGIGNGFNPGNWFKIPGNELGGTTPANDIQITVATINGGGGILTTTITGTAVSKQWTFGTTGGLTFPDSTVQTTAYTPVTGQWTVTTGTNTYSFTVPMDGTYTMWVKGNIPNGIITWNATLSISNTNVPAIGQQYAWNYTGGGSPILLTAIPDQVRGTAGTISTDATYVGTTSNRFDFGISNTSGASVTVYYGYTKV